MQFVKLVILIIFCALYPVEAAAVWDGGWVDGLGGQQLISFSLTTDQTFLWVLLWLNLNKDSALFLCLSSWDINHPFFREIL